MMLLRINFYCTSVVGVLLWGKYVHSSSTGSSLTMPYLKASKNSVVDRLVDCHEGTVVDIDDEAHC